MHLTKHETDRHRRTLPYTSNPCSLKRLSLRHGGAGAFDERHEIAERLEDLVEGRIALMDEAGVDVQVLSVTTPALQNLEPEESVQLARQTNDLLLTAITMNPARFQGFATLPTPAPQAAAFELDRCVRKYGSTLR